MWYKDPVTLILIFICFVVFLGILKIICKSPRVKGWFGERKIARIIGKTKQGVQYVINNFLFELEGKTVQIDHIVVNSNGVHVIETKNYAGRIYGNSSAHEWTQVLAYGKIKNKLYNPLKQNATHINKLKKKFNIDMEMVSLVVFVRKNVKNELVFTSSQLKKRLKGGCANYTVNQMELVYNQLLEYKNNNHISNKRHVSNVKKIQQGIKNNICPYCGGKLVKHNGMYGEFFGCENYPKCKFKKK